MESLNNLINKIIKDAKVESEKTVSDGENKAKEIMSISDKKLAKELELLENGAKREYAVTKERMLSNANLKARNEQLKLKQDIIANVYDEAMKELVNIDDKAYVDYINKHVSSKDSKIIVMKEKLNYVKSNLQGREVLEDRFVKSGFIEVKGKVESNFTFDTQLDLIKEDLQGNIAKILFDKE